MSSSTYVIVHLSNLSVNTYYQADAPNYGMFGGENGSPQASAHLPVPDGLAWDTVMAIRAEDGTIQLLEDPTKLAAKTQAQWTSVRAQQRQKLYESDWTCSVTDYEVPNKPEWVQYRAALRDVTKQSDPFAIMWPPVPQ
jgi:hypothetical protein